jgi:hypothetical protein
VWSLFSGKIIDSTQTGSQTATIANHKGRHKQQMYQSQFLENSIALESLLIAGKICRPDLRAIAGRQRPDLETRAQGGLEFCSWFLVASSGIEPELSALRGRRVNQLHHDATMS